MPETLQSLHLVSELNRDLLPDTERWLVIGPYCWGRSRSLPVALRNAHAAMGSFGGTFTARIIPEGELKVYDDGAYEVMDWTGEQQARASETTRVIAVTRGAAAGWKKQASEDLKKHLKQMIVLKPPQKS